MKRGDDILMCAQNEGQGKGRDHDQRGRDQHRREQPALAPVFGGGHDPGVSAAFGRRAQRGSGGSLRPEGTEPVGAPEAPPIPPGQAALLYLRLPGGSGGWSLLGTPGGLGHGGERACPRRLRRWYSGVSARPSTAKPPGWLRVIHLDWTS